MRNRSPAKMQIGSMPPVQYELVKLAGGLDQVTPTLSLGSGYARRAINFECSVTGGYTRIAGYERYDGRPAPTDAKYLVLEGTITDDVVVGDMVKGSKTGYTGEVILIHNGAIVLTRCTGLFDEHEDLLKGSVRVMVIDKVSVSANGQLDAKCTLLAQNAYRRDIQPVPGSGVVRGVSYYNGSVYAWRDSADGKTMNVYKDSPNGWVQLNLGTNIGFKDAQSEIKKGDKIYDPVGKGLATVIEVGLTSGSWKDKTADGVLTITTPTYPIPVGAKIEIGGVETFTTSTASTAVKLKPGGRVSTCIANFKGYSENAVLYGADGVNPAFEIYEDGTYVQVITGTPGENPQLVVAHQNHLFLSFSDSIIHSAIGNPHNFDPNAGAGEIVVISPITEWLVNTGNQSTGALTIYTKNETYVLYGTSSANWSLAPFNIGSGARMFTGQNMVDSYVLDDRGVMAMATSLNYGNFDSASLTLNIRDFIQNRRNIATGSCINREKSQYRVFFADGTGLYLTIVNGKKVGAIPVLFPDVVNCIVEGEKPDGSETSFFGSDNGFVYRLDVGGSFDGNEIFAGFELVYNAVKSPQILKRFRKASLEMNGGGYAEFDFGYSLSYGSGFLGQSNPGQKGQHYVADLRAAFYDSLIFDHFLWDRGENAPVDIGLTGTAENISFRVISNSNLYTPFTINTILVNYSLRRGLR